jgi:propanol-preferring alcohol dehydrogenase
MQRTMKAAVVRNFGKPLSIEEVAIPTPGPGQVLVQIVASGVCHTDLHAAQGDWPVKPTLPFIPGHEGTGYVVALGPGVTSLKEGDRVGVPWLHSACGACEHCITGWETLCGSQKNTGYSVNGGFAEYALAQASHAAHIPESLAFADAAPVLCAGVTTYKGLKETEVRPGQWVVISGIGGLGHMAVQYARAMGMRVAAVDVGQKQLDLARYLGAEIVLDANKDPAKEIQKLIGGAHGVLVTAVSPEAFRQSIGMLRPHGTCALVGLPPGDFATPIFEVVLKRLTIRGSIVGTRMDLQESLNLAANGRVRSAIERQPLGAINDVFDRMRRGAINGRVVLAIGD